MIIKRIITFGFVVCACVFTQAQTQICFDSTKTYSFTSVSNPLSVTNADFNLDGKTDLAFATEGYGSVSVLLGNSAGNFALALTYSITSGIIYALTSADFNKDGKPDIATMNRISNTVSVLLGDGTGNFAPALNFAVGTNPYFIITADFNRDGNPDLATTNFNDNSVSILRGDGTGNFSAAVNFSVGANPYSLTSGDFNKDGKLDIATANYNNSTSLLNNTLSVILGDGTGNFSTATTYTVGQHAWIVTNADYNNDGNIDLAVTAWQTGNTRTLSILFGNGTGGFTLVPNIIVTSLTGAMTNVDFNGDGNIDIAVVTGNNVSILIGNGAGNFASPVQFPIGIGSLSITSADFNGDGKPDLATADDNSSTASILISCTEFPPQKKNETQIIIPNIFTPNGDNINDEFFIKASNVSNFDCKIFSRWGLLIYEWSDINAGWNGANSTDGTYFYVITYTDNAGKANSKNGFIQLAR